MTTVLIDDRSGSKDLIKHPPLDSIGILTRLESGDVCLNGQGADGNDALIGVEVKSIGDLISSMNNGRLQASQIPLMLSTYNVSWLLYYGSHRTNSDGSLQVWKGQWRDYSIGNKVIPGGYLESFLLTLNSTGINIKRCNDIDEAAQWIGVLARWSAKSKHKAFHKFDDSRCVATIPGMDEVTHLMAETASRWPALGYERATAAAKHFGSIEDMATADVDEWKKVPGIGPVVAKAVRSAITRRRGA